jgi:pentatricopeptide repeat protein
MDTLYWMTGGSSTGAAAADKPTPPSMLGFAPAAADGLLFSNAGTTAGVQHPLIGALVGTDVPSTLQSQTAGSAVPAYSSTGAAMLRGMAGGYGVASSSGSILYATMPDSSRGSMGSGAYRRSHAYSSGVAGAQDANSSLGLSRSDFTLLGPAAAVAAQHGGSANHSVENLLEIVVALPHSTDAGVAVGPALAQLDSSALAALIKELGRTGHFQRSVELFDFVRRQAAPEYTHLLDIYTYTTAIAVCSSGQQLQRALDLMAEMRKRGVTCNVHTYSALMNVCIKCNEVALVQQVRCATPRHRACDMI